MTKKTKNVAFRASTGGRIIADGSRTHGFDQVAETDDSGYISLKDSEHTGNSKKDSSFARSVIHTVLSSLIARGIGAILILLFVAILAWLGFK